MTCAHRSLPLGSLVRVTNLRNRKSVVLRVNDRGPVAEDRIVDLSYAAANFLGVRGIAKVRLELLPAVAELSLPDAADQVIGIPGEQYRSGASRISLRAACRAFNRSIARIEPGCSISNYGASSQVVAPPLHEEARDRLIVALDFPSGRDALALRRSAGRRMPLVQSWPGALPGGWRFDRRDPARARPLRLSRSEIPRHPQHRRRSRALGRPARR